MSDQSTRRSFLTILAAAGGRSQMIVIGHEASEEAGMHELAAWLKPLVAGLPVRHVLAGDPFIYV